MTQAEAGGATPDPHAGAHAHVFLGPGHARNERRAWFVIVLCTAMMVIEIVGGLAFGSIALVADGIHMSTHAGAMLLAALAYTYARRHAHDRRFSFGTGKVGDIAGFTSAIVLAVIAILIGVESVARVFSPVAIGFDQAIPIAVLGLAVNLASAWLLAGEPHGHSHGHGHESAHDHDHEGDVAQSPAAEIEFRGGLVNLSIFESDGAARFRVTATPPLHLAPDEVAITVQDREEPRSFSFVVGAQGLLSRETLSAPAVFTAHLTLGRGAESERFRAEFGDLSPALEPALSHSRDDARAPAAAHHRDNNMRAVLVHVIADAVVSLFVIAGLILARAFGWRFMDPVAGVAGAVVIAVWAWRLIRDTGAILLDMNPDPKLAERLREAAEADGDKVTDLHLWRLGPGHLGAIVAIDSAQDRDAHDYRDRLLAFPAVSHLTVEVHRRA